MKIPCNLKWWGKFVYTKQASHGDRIGTKSIDRENKAVRK